MSTLYLLDVLFGALFMSYALFTKCKQYLLLSHILFLSLAGLYFFCERYSVSNVDLKNELSINITCIIYSTCVNLVEVLSTGTS